MCSKLWKYSLKSNDACVQEASKMGYKIHDRKHIYGLIARKHIYHLITIDRLGMSLSPNQSNYLSFNMCFVPATKCRLKIGSCNR